MEQNFIGWCQIFNGCLSNQWSHLQDSYLWCICKHSRHMNGLIWTIDVIDVIWDKCLTLWHYYNKHIHGHNTATWDVAYHWEAEAELTPSTNFAPCIYQQIRIYWWMKLTNTYFGLPPPFGIGYALSSRYSHTASKKPNNMPLQG